MLSKVKPLYILIAGSAVLVIISAVCYFTMVRPQYNGAQEGTLAWLTVEAQKYEDRANERGKWENEKATAERQVAMVQRLYRDALKTKGLPLNPSMEAEYTIRMWFLYLEDFANLTRQFLSNTPCEVMPRELALGAPPMPPSPSPGADGFLPMGGGYTLTAMGTMDQIWQFARSLSRFPNCVVRLNSLSFTLPQPDPGDGTVFATLPIQMWMLVERGGAASKAPVVGGASGGGGGGEDGEDGGDDTGQEEESQPEEEQDDEGGGAEENSE